MIIVISATNRIGSNTAKVAKHYFQTIQQKTSDTVQFLDLSEIPFAWYENPTFATDAQHPELRAIQEKCIIPATHFVFVIPEYNGSIPGVLKLFIDACSIYEMKASFKIGTKRALLAGVSSGRAGNLRGMEHLCGMLNYLNINVLPNMLPISGIGGLLDENGNIKDEGTIKVIGSQIDSFLNSLS